MSKGAISFSSDNEYYTPKSIVSRFGSFDYDPATTSKKAEDLGIANYDTIESNGLKTDWTQFGRIWINPPFTMKQLFLEKAVRTYLQAHNDIYFLIPIAFITTKTFSQQTKARKVGVKLFVPNGRIKFESGLGKELRTPAFGTVVFKLQDKNEIEFIEI